VGRTFSPAWFSTDLVWYNEINLTASRQTGTLPVTQNLKLFSTAGIFPIDFSPFNFPTIRAPNETAATSGSTARKRAGLDAEQGLRLQVAVSYYDFDFDSGKTFVTLRCA